jgi:dTDP-4-amino-4,6-dideoxygalactose transaminase
MELRQLRPVGNRFKLSSRPFNEQVFFPFSFYGFGSGTQALAAAILAVKNRVRGDESSEVIVPAYTCPDVISACEFAEVKVRLVDLAPKSCRMDLKDLEAKLSKNTIAIIAINFLGIPEDIASIKTIAGNKTIIEDSAQGMSVDNNEHYWQGDLVVLSFGRGKPLNLMSGGAILTKQASWHEFIPRLSPINNRLMARAKYHTLLRAMHLCFNPRIYFGIARLPGVELGATHYKPLTQIEPISVHVLLLLTEAIKQFRMTVGIWRNYYQNFKGSIHYQLSDLNRVISDSTILLLRYPVFIEDHEIINSIHPRYNKLGLTRFYQKTLPNIPDVPKHIMCNPDDTFPNAEYMASNLVTLPCFNDLNLSDQRRIINYLQNISN